MTLTADRTGVRHDRAPLTEAVQQYRDQGTRSWHVPGHKGGRLLDAQVRQLLGEEMPKSDVWLETSVAGHVLRQAEDLAAAAWGADRAWYLANGSSSGNHAAILALTQPGRPVLVSRDMHTSTLTALIMTGAVPKFLTPQFDSERTISMGVSVEEVTAALAAHPNASLVSVVSPTYSGVCSDVAAIAHVVHSRDTLLHVDEAWGPHLAFHPDLPTHAIEAGADTVITSAHKTLPAISQGAILMARADGVPIDRLTNAVRMTQSTSPLLPIYASIDGARRVMVRQGRQLLDRTLEVANELRSRLSAIPGLRVLDASDLPRPELADPLKLVIDVRGLGVTGFHVEQLLRSRYAVAPEGADLGNVYLVLTVADDGPSSRRLSRIFQQLTAEVASDRPASTSEAALLGDIKKLLEPRPQACTPREAYYAGTTSVRLKNAVGRIIAEPVTPYPPGIPVLLPGEVVDADTVEWLTGAAAVGAHVHGVADPHLHTVQVVKE